MIIKSKGTTYDNYALYAEHSRSYKRINIEAIFYSVMRASFKHVLENTMSIWIKHREQPNKVLNSIELDLREYSILDIKRIGYSLARIEFSKLQERVKNQIHLAKIERAEIKRKSAKIAKKRNYTRLFNSLECNIHTYYNNRYLTENMRSKLRNEINVLFARLEDQFKIKVEFMK